MGLRKKSPKKDSAQIRPHTSVRTMPSDPLTKGVRTIDPSGRCTVHHAAERKSSRSRPCSLLIASRYRVSLAERRGLSDRSTRAASEARRRYFSRAARAPRVPVPWDELFERTNLTFELFVLHGEPGRRPWTRTPKRPTDKVEKKKRPGRGRDCTVAVPKTQSSATPRRKGRRRWDAR